MRIQIKHYYSTSTIDGVVISQMYLVSRKTWRALRRLPTHNYIELGTVYVPAQQPAHVCKKYQVTYWTVAQTAYAWTVVMNNVIADLETAFDVDDIQLYVRFQHTNSQVIVSNK
jgi:hypothetical protein